MNLEVTQKNLYHFLSGKISLVAEMLMKERNLTPIEAIRHFYSSDVYGQLEQEKTKYWHLGPVALYGEMK